MVGRQPADDDAVVLAQPLARQDNVVSYCATEGLVDREVAQEFVGGGAVELGVVDELLPEVGVGAQVQQGQRGLRGGGVDAAADQVPQDVEQLLVGEAVAVELESNEEAGQVFFRFRASGGGVVEDFLHHRRHLGNRGGVLVAVRGDRHDRVKQVGVQVPIVVGQTHQLHGEDGRDGAGVVEHQVHLPGGYLLVEEPVGGLLHERLEFLDGAGGEERGQRVT